ncbi:MAG: PqqD family protein [Rhizomicrobium sp.]
MKPTAVARVRADCEVKEFERGILIAPDIALNDTAAFVFRALDGKRSVIDVANAVAGAYAVGREEAVEDVIAILEHLEESGVVQVER